MSRINKKKFFIYMCFLNPVYEKNFYSLGLYCSYLNVKKYEINHIFSNNLPNAKKCNKISMDGILISII